MATTPEGKIKDHCKKILGKYKPNVYYFMPAMGSFGKAGVPDIIACVGGVFFGIEVKHDASKNPPTELQKMNLRDIAQAGGAALVIDKDNVDDLEALILTVLAGKPDE